MEKLLVILLHNLKDITVISNRAKFYFEIRWKKGYTIRLKFVFWSAAIKVVECEKKYESRRAYDVIGLTTTTKG